MPRPQARGCCGVEVGTLPSLVPKPALGLERVRFLALAPRSRLCLGRVRHPALRAPGDSLCQPGQPGIRLFLVQATICTFPHCQHLLSMARCKKSEGVPPAEHPDSDDPTADTQFQNVVKDFLNTPRTPHKPHKPHTAAKPRKSDG